MSDKSSDASVQTAITPDHEIDVTREYCPMTFVRTRLALDKLRSGQVLQVLMKGEEPRRNVPRTAAEQGHAVLALVDEPEGVTRMLVRRK